MTITTNCGKTFEVKVRLDTDVEIEYYKNGGILQYVLRKLVKVWLIWIIFIFNLL